MFAIKMSHTTLDCFTIEVQNVQTLQCFHFAECNVGLSWTETTIFHINNLLFRVSLCTLIVYCGCPGPMLMSVGTVGEPFLVFAGNTTSYLATCTALVYVLQYELARLDCLQTKTVVVKLD